MFEKKSRLFNNHSDEVNPDLINKPPMCLSCKKNDDPSEEVFCILNRVGQQETGAFHCNAYQAITF
jgi:hypothetical protein